MRKLLVLGGLLATAFVINALTTEDVDAQVFQYPKVVFPSTDGGQFLAPNGRQDAFVLVFNTTYCGGTGVQTILSQDYASFGGATNTNSIRVGPCFAPKLRANPPALANGIIVTAGNAMEWKFGGPLCVISDNLDAGVTIGAVAGCGARQ